MKDHVYVVAHKIDGRLEYLADGRQIVSRPEHASRFEKVLAAMSNVEILNSQRSAGGGKWFVAMWQVDNGGEGAINA